MSTKAGALLWRRMHLDLAAGVTDIDTGLTQLGKSFAADSPGEPILAIGGASAPAPGTLPASRVQVLPQAPFEPWVDVTHTEPWFSTTTKTVHVTFTNNNKSTITVNVWIFDPHTLIGPGQAAAYNDIG